MASTLFVANDPDSDPETTMDPDLFASQLKAIVGDISSVTTKKLFDKFSDKRLLDAVNYYFDHQEEFQLEELQQEQPEVPESDHAVAVDTDSARGLKRERRELAQEVENLETNLAILSKKRALEEKLKEKEFMENKKYIGSLSVDAWCTRSVFRTLDYGKKMKLFVTENFVKLLDPTNGDREIAKIPNEIAKFLAPVLLYKICICDVTVIYNDKRLRMGDSFLVQLDIYINPQFIKSQQDISQTIKPVRGESASKKAFGRELAETVEEKEQRLRRTCLSTLFDLLNLKPLSSDQKPDSESAKEMETVVLDSDGEEEDAATAEDQQTTEDEISGWDEIKKNREIGSADDTDPNGVLNLDQLKKIYKSTQMNFTSTTDALALTEPKDVKLELRRYQKAGLTWLLTREQEYQLINGGADLEQKHRGVEVMNPLWKEYKWPVDKSWDSKDKTKDATESLFYFNHYSGELSDEKPLIQSSCMGGILADEMGLGKTISTYSLINTCPADSSYDSRDSFKDRYAYKTTLIVVPMSLIYQWEKEFEKVNANSANKCLVYYGNNGYLGQDILRLSPTVVLTTYGTVQNEAAKGLDIGLFSIKFFRVVLDEAHNIRNRTTKTAKSCSELKAKRRWALTGTPIINRLDDVFSLVKFLRLSPWDSYNIWNTFVTKPFEEKQLSKSLETMESILTPIILRRTKTQRDENGDPLVELPSKNVVIEKLKFNDKERKVYEFFKNRATSSLKSNKNILANYTNILTHILRLRQVCCHLDLIYSTEGDEDTNSLEQRLAVVHNTEHADDYGEERAIMEMLKEDSNSIGEDEEIALKEKIYQRYDLETLSDIECAICTTHPIQLKEMVITSECQHCYCKDCLLDLFNFKKKESTPDGNDTGVRRDGEVLCPVCRQAIDQRRLFRAEAADVERGYTVQLYRPYFKSSKVNALLKSLDAIHEQESVVVFSPFSTFLDLIETELDKYPERFVHFKFDGRLKMDERQKILSEFTNPPPKDKDNRVRVLLISLKAGGVGLNLTVASKAYLLSPWWAPSVENQAIDRIHRIGQLKDVSVVRFIIENSIEEKMLKVQERKKHLGEVVEADDEERRKQRIEEIMMLLED